MLASLLLGFAALAHGAAGEVEIRLPLTKAGYEKLAGLREPGAKLSRRRDSYFDAFDGRDFRLKRLPNAVKARLKDKDGELSFQTSTLASRRRVEAAGLWAELAETESEEGSVEGAFGSQLRGLAAEFFAALARPGAAVLPAAERVHALLEGGDWPGKERVGAARKGLGPTRLFPAASNVKERMTVSLPGGASFKLGKTQALDEDGAAVTLYELESDGKADGAEERARKLLKSLKAAGLSAEDIGGPSPDAFRFAARRLVE